MRPRDAGGTGLGAAGHHRLRPRLRIRPLPRRRRPPDRQAHRRRGNRRVRAARRSRPGSPAPGHRPLHLRRRHQPHGRRASQGLPVDRSAGTRQAAVLPRPEHPRRQLPARRHPRAPGRRPPRRGLHPDRRRRPQGRRSPQKAERRRALKASTTCSAQSGIPVTNAVLAKRAAEIAHALPDSLEDLHIHQQRQAQELAESPEHRIQKLLADAWCAAFVQPKTADTRATAITQAVLEQFGADAGTLELAAAEDLVADLTRQYRFFHWHVEFPHIFRVGNGATDIDPATGWAGGFSCVIGNPPWERVKLQEQEFFAARRPEIANAANAAARKKLIAALADSDSPPTATLSDEFQAELRKAAGWSHLLRESGRYPADRPRRHQHLRRLRRDRSHDHRRDGRLGIIVPTGIATDATTASPFFGDIVRNEQLDSLLDFVTNPRLWTEVGHRRYRFSILVLTGTMTRSKYAEFATLTKHPMDLPPRGQRIRLPTSDLLLVNPNTGTCPMFQTQRDAEITIRYLQTGPGAVARRLRGESWGLSFMQGTFNMASDSGLFRTREQLRSDGWLLDWQCLRQGRQADAAAVRGETRPPFRPSSCQLRQACGWKPRHASCRALTLMRRTTPRDHRSPAIGSPRSRWTSAWLGVDGNENWLLGWRDICRSTDERTMICSAIPRVAVGDTYLLAFTQKGAEFLQANLSSFVLDYVARQKFAGTSLKYFLVKQLPVLPPTAYQENLPWLTSVAATNWIRSTSPRADLHCLRHGGIRARSRRRWAAVSVG